MADVVVRVVVTVADVVVRVVVTVADVVVSLVCATVAVGMGSVDVTTTVGTTVLRGTPPSDAIPKPMPPAPKSVCPTKFRPSSTLVHMENGLGVPTRTQSPAL